MKNIYEVKVSKFNWEYVLADSAKAVDDHCKANNHKAAGREEECGEYREKACNCRHELARRATK